MSMNGKLQNLKIIFGKEKSRAFLSNANCLRLAVKENLAVDSIFFAASQARARRKGGVGGILAFDIIFSAASKAGGRGRGGVGEIPPRPSANISTPPPARLEQNAE